MGFFDWIKNSGEKLRRVEDKIYQQRTDFVEIYQRNLDLEREISQRTEELHNANQTLLTLEHVWDMMNSSRPLSSVLETIVSSLHGEFRYLYSCIIQKQLDSKGEFFAFRTYLQNDFSMKLDGCLKTPIFETRINISKESSLYEAIENKKFKYYTINEDIFSLLFP